ncbi:MAG: EAL domain-containing protein [Mesorhizobium sp.]|nr:EAL domain-containing protein [Mesorhizobium sp.]
MTGKTMCQGCRDGQDVGFDFTMAFQPIVDVVAGRVWGYEALVRGMQGQPAGEILALVDGTNRYAFDQACRVKAIDLASTLFPADGDCMLSINFMPNAVYEPSACIRATLAAARRTGFDTRRLMFEFTEDERISDTAHLENIINAYRRLGFTTALDDFGAGYAGLALLAKFQPDLIKLDMELIRGIATSPARQAIVASLAGLARQLDIQVIAEGVETEAELTVLRSAGLRLFQGYLFARPSLARLPELEFDLAA